MRNKAKILELDKRFAQEEAETRILLPSGRRLSINADDCGELLEITEASGKATIKILLTDAGPVFKVEGARLAISSSQAISLDAPIVSINASKKATVTSKGDLAIKAREKISLDADDEIRANAAMIHLN